ncbi:MAG: hypothetical protein AAFO91_00600, partial [Bacteroidota bacterium]
MSRVFGNISSIPNRPFSNKRFRIESDSDDNGNGGGGGGGGGTVTDGGTFLRVTDDAGSEILISVVDAADKSIRYGDSGNFAIGRTSGSNDISFTPTFIRVGKSLRLDNGLVVSSSSGTGKDVIWTVDSTGVSTLQFENGKSFIFSTANTSEILTVEETEVVSTVGLQAPSFELADGSSFTDGRFSLNNSSNDEFFRIDELTESGFVITYGTRLFIRTALGNNDIELNSNFTRFLREVRFENGITLTGGDIEGSAKITSVTAIANQNAVEIATLRDRADETDTDVEALQDRALAVETQANTNQVDISTNTASLNTLDGRVTTLEQNNGNIPADLQVTSIQLGTQSASLTESKLTLVNASNVDTFFSIDVVGN